MIQLVKTFQVPGSKSVLQLCLVIKTNGNIPEKLFAQAPALPVCRTFLPDAALEDIISDVRNKDVGAFCTTLLLPDTLFFTHSLSQPVFCLSHHIIKYYFDAVEPCIISRQGRSREGNSGPGHQLELGTSTVIRSQTAVHGYPMSETVSKSVDTRTVLFQSMKVDNNVEKV